MSEARKSDTYRASRREIHKAARRLNRRDMAGVTFSEVWMGSGLRADVRVKSGNPQPSRSKYMPHIGKKQRSRRA